MTGDPGDEHVERPPPPRDEISVLLEASGAECINADLFYFISLAECLRYCCAACALAANGEDGS